MNRVKGQLHSGRKYMQKTNIWTKDKKKKKDSYSKYTHKKTLQEENQQLDLKNK